MSRAACIRTRPWCTAPGRRPHRRWCRRRTRYYEPVLTKGSERCAPEVVADVAHLAIALEFPATACFLVAAVLVVLTLRVGAPALGEADALQFDQEVVSFFCRSSRSPFTTLRGIVRKRPARSCGTPLPTMGLERTHARNPARKRVRARPHGPCLNNRLDSNMRNTFAVVGGKFERALGLERLGRGCRPASTKNALLNVNRNRLDEEIRTHPRAELDETAWAVRGRSSNRARTCASVGWPTSAHENGSFFAQAREEVSRERVASIFVKSHDQKQLGFSR